MSKINVGVPGAVLALFQPATGPTSWDPTQPAHNWGDPEAAALVAAGNPTAEMEYCYFAGMNGAASIAELPTFTCPAAEAAAPNYPVRVVLQGGDSYPANATGTIIPGSKPMTFLQQPLRQLEPNEDIQTVGPFAVPTVVLNEPTVPSSVLSETAGQPLFLSEGNQAYILETLATMAGQIAALAAAQDNPPNASAEK